MKAAYEYNSGHCSTSKLSNMSHHLILLSLTHCRLLEWRKKDKIRMWEREGVPSPTAKTKIDSCVLWHCVRHDSAVYRIQKCFIWAKLCGKHMVPLCYLPFGSLWLFSISHAKRFAKLQLHTQGLPSSRTTRKEGNWLSAPTFRVDSALRSSSSSLKEVRPRKASSFTMLRYGLLPSRSLIRLRDSPNVPFGISVKLLLPKSRKTNLDVVLSVPGSMWERELFRRSR